MNNYIEEIKKDIRTRQNLIALKEEVKDEEQRRALAYYLAGDFSVFTECLKHSDPKVRKNAALILGEMECDDVRQDLWTAYQKEDTLFVRADYLKSLSRYDCAMFLPQMKKQLKDLLAKDILPEEEKHIRKECTVLKGIIMHYERPKKHKFIGYDMMHEIILMTNRNHRDVTVRQLPEAEVKMLAGGIKCKTEHLRDVLTIRTYSEMLFPISGTALLSGSPERMAGQLLDSDMMSFLEDNHERSDEPFYFRTEVKSSMDQGQKVDLVKKISAALERLGGRRMLNATSGYEIELRLVANKEGRFVPLLKLFTVPDWRFAYRKDVLPTSVAPVNAALFMELAGEYLKENAQVLDPFCGVGTMLIERHKKCPAAAMYGLDILEEAVQKARSNTELAHMKVNYINRNFFDFRHEYLFDEIVTNLPGKGWNQEDVSTLCRRFFEKISEVLKNDAVILVYTSTRDIFIREADRSGLCYVEKEYLINEKEGSYLEILRYRAD